MDREAWLGHSFGEIGLFPIQPKLVVGPADDKYEREADRVAEQVMRMPEGDVLQRKSAKCDEDEKKVLQAKESPKQVSLNPARDVPPIVQGVLHSPGQPLDTEKRAFMEPRFGHDFSQVRVYTDAKAAESAQVVGARAYTVGRKIVFGTQQYSFGTPAGRRLLAHELTHFIQQSYSRLVLRREVQPANEAQLRGFVQDAIHFLRAAAIFYNARVEVDQVRLRSALDNWLTIVQNTQRIITQDLGGDAALLAQLRDVYRSAVAAMIRAASGSPQRTLHDLYQSNRERIHEWAWIQPSTDPDAHALSYALPEAERQRIRVITGDINIGGLHDLFSTEGGRTTVRLPPGVTVNYAGTFADELRLGLSNVAGRLIQSSSTLSLNATITLALDLGAYGGDFSAFRFTYVEHRSPSGQTSREVLIERLGAIGVEGLTASQSHAQEERFRQHSFSRGSGWSDEEFEALLQVIAQIPDNLLTPVDGLTFNRAAVSPTNPSAGGDYEPHTHTITMYDLSFTASLTRFGTPGAGGISSNAVRDIAHEIGHAIDLRPLRQVWTNLEQAREALRLAFQQYESPPGSGQYHFPNTEQTRWNTLQQNITQAEQVMAQTRSASGYRWQQQAGVWDVVEGGTAAGNNAFRLAAQQDGAVRVTEYSDTEWQEYFAEAFSLYITNPTVLQQLRPHVYDYFVSNYPR